MDGRVEYLYRFDLSSLEDLRFELPSFSELYARVSPILLLYLVILFYFFESFLLALEHLHKAGRRVKAQFHELTNHRILDF